MNFTYRVGTMVRASQKESFYVLLVRCLCTAYLGLGLFTLHPDSKLETSPTPSSHNPKPHYSKHETPSFAASCQVELPRAALQAGRLAEQAEFFSFGTNDLTQTTYGLSRDDAGRGGGRQREREGERAGGAQDSFWILILGSGLHGSEKIQTCGSRLTTQGPSCLSTRQRVSSSRIPL